MGTKGAKGEAGEGDRKDTKQNLGKAGQCTEGSEDRAHKDVKGRCTQYINGRREVDQRRKGVGQTPIRWGGEAGQLLDTEGTEQDECSVVFIAKCS